MVLGQFIWEEKKYDCILTSNQTQNSTADLKEGSKTLKLKLWKETKKKIFDFMEEKVFLNKTNVWIIHVKNCFTINSSPHKTTIK